MRVYNITIYDDTGFALCFMNELELRKTVMDSGPHVENRYEMILQPVLPNITTPRLESTWTREREDKTNRTNLLQTLDRLAFEMLQKSLEEDVQVGEEIDRKRYEAFARSALARSDPPAPVSHDVGAMKQALSAPFEITERVAKVHKDTFSSSKVRILMHPFDDAFLTSIYRQPCNHSSPMT